MVVKKTSAKKPQAKKQSRVKKQPAVKEVLQATLVGDVQSYGFKGKIFPNGVPVEVDVELFKACKKTKFAGKPVFKCEKVKIEADVKEKE